MTRNQVKSIACITLLALLTSGAAFAQTPPQNAAGRGQKAGPGRAARAGLPTVSTTTTPQQLQGIIEGYAVVQARKVLALTDEQWPTFVARFNSVQQIRRRGMMEERRLKNEIRNLLPGTAAARDATLLDRLKALDDVSDRTAVELRKAYQDVDAVLTPWQRGRLRLFEDEVERLKISLLGKIGGS